MSTASGSDGEITNSLRLTTPGSYLFLPDNPFLNSPPFKPNYVIFLAPMNSSGDIYHIITYLMLSKNENKKLPAVLLSYDGTATLESQESKMNTFSQTQRCTEFAKYLGFKAQFITPVSFGKGGYRQNTRFNKMFNYLKEKNDETKDIYYIEQKLLTTLIANYFVEYSRPCTVEILKKLYAEWSVNEGINQKIKESVKEKIQSIHTEKPLIILQHRYSSKANENQNIREPNVFIHLEEYLKSHGYVTSYLFVDSRSSKPSTLEQIKNQTNCFPHNIGSVDYGKLFHLEFLLQSLEMKNLKGIIGNTSGCLDLAAFVGHNVLNLHQFYDKLNYQSYRIFLQSSFLTIENFNKDVTINDLQDKKRRWINFTNETVNKNMPIATKWINQTQNTPTFPVQLLKSVLKVDVNTAGFNHLHQIIAWKDGKTLTRKIFMYYVLTYYILLYFVTFFLLSR